jgi:hypothetical protein
MEETIRKIKERAEADRERIGLLTKLLEDCPDGRIQVSTVKNHRRYYLIKDGRRSYVGRDKFDLVQRLMKKEYYLKLRSTMETELKNLEKFVGSFDPRAAIRVYEEMHEERRRIVEPLVAPEKQFAEQWLAEKERSAAAQTNSYARPEEFKTLNGEYVRSKSEKILADLFYHYHIPYVYECPLQLGDRTVYPDFTILNVRTGKVYYWEHLGRMDDPDYTNDAILKIRNYERSGILIGNQLLISMESSKIPLNVQDIERMIRQYLL